MFSGETSENQRFKQKSPLDIQKTSLVIFCSHSLWNTTMRWEEDVP